MESVLRLSDTAQAIEGFAGRTLDYALVLAAVGTITMALVELVKAVTRGRLVFHRWMVQKWIGSDASVRRQLLELAVGGEGAANALYDQPSGKMLGQIQAAANVALDFPGVYEALYDFLSRGSATVGGTEDHARWKSFAPRIAEGIPSEGAQKEAFEQDSRQSTQARARLGNLVMRKLDAFQTRIEYSWARMNQALAVVGGAIFLYIVLPPTVNPAARVMMAVLGGLVAPFAKDVVNALTGLRARR